jgi:hypothetical protein
MSAQQISENKLQLIHWITELEDAKLIEELMEFQVKNNDIPQWQKEELDRRTNDYEKNPDSFLEFKELAKHIKLKK